MPTWLALLIFFSGVTIFSASMVYVVAFLRSQRGNRERLALHQRASIAACLPPVEAQKELAAVLSELQERLNVVEHPTKDSRVPGGTRTGRRTRFSGRN